MSKQQSKQTRKQQRGAPTRTAPGRTKPTVSEAKQARRPKRSSSRSLAQQRRLRLWLLIAVLVVANVAVALVWRNWAASLAAGIGSVIVAPLLAALLLRRR